MARATLGLDRSLRVHPGRCRVLSSIPGPHPLNVRRSPSHDNHRCPQTPPRVRRGAEPPQVRTPPKCAMSLHSGFRAFGLPRFPVTSGLWKLHLLHDRVCPTDLSSRGTFTGQGSDFAILGAGRPRASCSTSLLLLCRLQSDGWSKPKGNTPGHPSRPGPRPRPRPNPRPPNYPHRGGDQARGLHPSAAARPGQALPGAAAPGVGHRSSAAGSCPGPAVAEALSAERPRDPSAPRPPGRPRPPLAPQLTHAAPGRAPRTDPAVRLRACAPRGRELQVPEGSGRDPGSPSLWGQRVESQRSLRAGGVSAGLRCLLQLSTSSGPRRTWALPE